jgi:hypothetical protein
VHGTKKNNPIPKRTPQCLMPDAQCLSIGQTTIDCYQNIFKDKIVLQERILLTEVLNITLQITLESGIKFFPKKILLRLVLPEVHEVSVVGKLVFETRGWPPGERQI